MTKKMTALDLENTAVLNAAIREGLVGDITADLIRAEIADDDDQQTLRVKRMAKGLRGITWFNVGAHSEDRNYSILGVVLYRAAGKWIGNLAHVTGKRIFDGKRLAYQWTSWASAREAQRSIATHISIREMKEAAEARAEADTQGEAMSAWIAQN